MARGLSPGAWATLVLGGLLLILPSQQALTAQAGGELVRSGDELPRVPAPQAIPAGWFQLLSRATRSTPFWRTVGSKPLGAHCLRGLECSTQACRNGRCANPHVKS